jgi:serine/threonine protein kinase
VALDIANGLKYLHSINIAHNDLACRNCLVTYKLSAKIGDYGLSRENFKEDYYSRQPGQKMLPIRWMAPELINTDREDVIKSFPPTFKGNMWSLGITLWELCSCCQWPYEDLMNEEVIEFVKTTEESVLDNPVEEGDSLYPMYAVMKKCWMKPENRPTASEVVDMLRDLQPKKKKVSRAAPVSAPAKSKVESKKTDNDKPIDPPALGSSPQKVQPPTDTTSETGPGGVNDVSQDTFIKEKEEQFQPLLLSSSDKPQKEMTPEPQETSKTAKKATKDNAGEPAKKSKSSSKSKKKSTTEEVQGKPKKSRSVSKSSTKQEKKSSTGSKEEGRSKPRSYSSGAGRPKPSRDSYYGYGGDDDDDGDDPPVVVYDEDIAALIW